MGAAGWLLMKGALFMSKAAPEYPDVLPAESGWVGVGVMPSSAKGKFNATGNTVSIVTVSGKTGRNPYESVLNTDHLYDTAGTYSMLS